jgi:hypothetical protein
MAFASISTTDLDLIGEEGWAKKALPGQYCR